MFAIIIAGSAIAAFTCLLLLTKRPLADPETVAAVFMLLLALPMLEKLLLAGTISLAHPGSSLFLGAPLTFGPFLYLYARSVIHPGSLRRPRSLLHFLPFLASLGVLLVPGTTLPGGASLASMDGASPDPGPWVLDSLIVLSFVAYTALIIIMLRAHAKNIPDFFSRDSIAITLRWLGWLTVCFFLAYILVIGGAWILPGSTGVPLVETPSIRDIGTVFFIIVFGFGAIKQPVLFKAGPEELRGPAPRGSEDPAVRKYGKSGLRDDEATMLLARLEGRMLSAKPWLDADLTIEDLALALGVQRHHLTQVINDRLGKNFYRYVNEHRVEEVKRKIAQGEAERLSILGVALDSGFNSKSAFNEAFKGIMGCTPSEYRKGLRP